MSSVRCLLLTCSFLAARASEGQVPREIKGAAGCYALTTTAWSPRIGSDSASHRLPTTVRLDTVRSTFAPGWALSPNITYRLGQAMPPTWRIDADTMRLAWSNGELPTYVTLVRTDSAWTGDAIAESEDHSDPARSLPHSHVTARRQACAPNPQ